MKKVLVISSVLLSIVFLSWCSQKLVSKTQPATPAPVVQTPVNNQTAATPKSIPIADNNIYSNQEFGFKITLTNRWKDYKTFSIKGDPNLNIKFCIPSSANSKFKTKTPGYECLFKLSALKIKEKEKYQKSIDLCEKQQKETGVAMRPCNAEIGRNDKYIILGEVIVQDSTDKGMLALKDVDKIFNSFQSIE